MSGQRGWIGVDLDGTLAEYHGWQGTEHIGPPIPAMVARVKEWLEAGIEVRVVTARCHYSQPEATEYVRDWCAVHLGERLRVTCEKDFGMVELWDDRAVQVETNTARRLDHDAARMEAIDTELDDIRWVRPEGHPDGPLVEADWFVGDGGGHTLTHGPTIRAAVDAYLTLKREADGVPS